MKKEQKDYSWITQQVFDEKLEEILNRYSAADVAFLVPDVDALLREHFTNQVLDELTEEKDI